MGNDKKVQTKLDLYRLTWTIIYTYISSLEEKIDKNVLKFKVFEKLLPKYSYC